MNIAFIILSAALLLGIFVCGLCNYAISGRFDWSLYVLGGAVTAWLITAPLLKFGKYRGIFSLAGLSIAIAPLLFLIEYVTPAKGWVIPSALPLVIVSLVSLWAFVLLVTFIRTRVTYLIALALVLFGVVDNLIIHQFIQSYLKLAPDPSSAIVAVSCGVVAVLLFILPIVL